MFKTSAMLRNYMTFHREAVKAVENDVTWAKVREAGTSIFGQHLTPHLQIRDSASDVIFQLSQQKFEVSETREGLRTSFDPWFLSPRSSSFQDPTTSSRDEIEKKMESLNSQIVEKFREMLE